MSPDPNPWLDESAMRAATEALVPFVVGVLAGVAWLVLIAVS